MCGKNYILTVGVMTEERSGTIYNFNMPKGKLDDYQPYYAMGQLLYA